jgi:hypothetical protein
MKDSGRMGRGTEEVSSYSLMELSTLDSTK